MAIPSDGEEDKKLKSLIREGKINKFTKPSTLQKDYPDVFGSFSPQVIRNHLNTVKRTNGLYLDAEDDGDVYSHPDEDEFKELDATPRASNSSDNSVAGDKAAHQNYPIIIKQFICPETDTEKVLLVASLPADAQLPKVELHDDGIGVSIKYSWPKLQSGRFHEYHPIILGFKSGLEEVRRKIDVDPDGLIKVVLPIKVQTAIKSWQKWGDTRDDGSQVVLAEFSGYAKDYVKKISDEYVQFD